jgi:glutathione S-transferase
MGAVHRMPRAPNAVSVDERGVAMLRVLGRKGSSNVRKVLWALEELNLPFEREDIGGEFGRNREPAFLALNPNGLVPVLVDGNLALWESNTILRYLAARYGQGSLWEPDAVQRALQERWLDWQLSLVTPALNLLAGALVVKPPQARSPEEIDRARNQLDEAFRILDRELAGKAFLGGDRLSIADIAVGVAVLRWFGLPIERAALPELQRWYDTLASRPAFRNKVAV